ncbi:hypothetical protein [Bacillus sp. NPDC077027]|uniref:hypothetical protein n=1 Tax=Bacillus sp. NPDC077027 TaxID=3390548 RepID=UPI003D082F66
MIMIDFIPMPHTVKILKSSEQDAWGINVVDESTAVEIKCRISYNTQRDVIVLASGEEIVYAATILLTGLPTLEYTDLIEFTDDMNNIIKKNPLNIRYKHDFSGNTIGVKVYV